MCPYFWSGSCHLTCRWCMWGARGHWVRCWMLLISWNSQSAALTSSAPPLVLIFIASSLRSLSLIGKEQSCELRGQGELVLGLWSCTDYKCFLPRFFVRQIYKACKMHVRWTVGNSAFRIENCLNLIHPPCHLNLLLTPRACHSFSGAL